MKVEKQYCDICGSQIISSDNVFVPYKNNTANYRIALIRTRGDVTLTDLTLDICVACQRKVVDTLDSIPYKVDRVL